MSIGETGEVGSLLRRGRGKPSSACGALIAIRNGIASREGVTEDDKDREFVTLKKKIVAKVCADTGFTIRGFKETRLERSG